jgi:hypothetical protein
MIYWKRDTIRSKLLAWQLNEISTSEIWNWVLTEWHPGEDDYEDNDVNAEGKNVSVIWDILYILEEIKWNYHTQADIPQLLAYLGTPIGQYDNGLAILNGYYSTINWEKRKTELRSITPYSEST